MREKETEQTGSRRPAAVQPSGEKLEQRRGRTASEPEVNSSIGERVQGNRNASGGSERNRMSSPEEKRRRKKLVERVR